MIVDYILFFFLGVGSLAGLFLLRRKYLKWKCHRLTMKRARIRLEENGWMKTDFQFLCWGNRTRMNKWHREYQDDLEVCIWLKVNTTGNFKVDWIDGKRYVRFDKDEDGMAFKLRWI